MSVTKYIIQSCSNSNKYRINIDGTSHLFVGETWFIECETIESGCYQILKDDDKIKTEISVDECSFIEYGTCYDCEAQNSVKPVFVPTNSYLAVFVDCDGNPENFYLNEDYYNDEILGSSANYYYTYEGICYQFSSAYTDVTYGEEQPYIGPGTMSNTTCCSSVPVTPTPVLPEDCYSATTTGQYNFTDCCGTERFGNSINSIYCVDTSKFYSGVTISTSLCNQDCDGGPLSVVYTTEPNCGRPGEIVLEVSGGLPPYNVQNIIPGTLNSQTGNGPFVFENLTAGNYTFNIWDNTLPVARETFVSAYVSPCLETEIEAIDIECNSSLGYISITATSESYPITTQLYFNNNLYLTSTESQNIILFTNLPAGEYYAILTDGVFQTGQTDTVIIEDPSENITFDINVTGASTCDITTGSAQIVNVSGALPPFTYLWSNGQTTSLATGFTAGEHSVTLTDSKGCTKRETFIIPQIDELGISRILPTQPNCFECDGEALIVITGGTSPFFFSGSTGQIQPYEESSQQFNFSGLCSGIHQVYIEDSNGCSILESFSLESTAGFTVVGINTTPADCGENGTIEILVDGVVGLLTYSITGSTGITETITKYGQSHTFTNLPAGTYTVEVTNKDETCVYTKEVEIIGEERFTIETTTTGTTCGLDNGSVIIDVISGTTEIQYPLTYLITRVNDGQVLVTYSSVNSSSQLITDIPTGNYYIQVTDNQGCVVTESFQILDQYKGVEAILYGTNCVNGNDGTATLIINNGTPPFNITWSNGVTGQQNLSGLSGGTYSVTVEDSNGCTWTKSVDIDCGVEIINDYVVNTVCEDVFETGEPGIKTFEEILYEAYLNASLPGQICDFNYAVWSACLTISGDSYNGSGENCVYDFFFSNTLDDVPTPELWEQVVQNLLSLFPDINWTTNLENNTYTITSNCDGDDDPLRGAYVELSISIEIDLSCTNNRPKPTPSLKPQPTLTPTPSITPTPTPTKPDFECELVVVGGGRELSCTLEVIASVRDIDCLLDVDTSVRDLSCELGVNTGIRPLSCEMDIIQE